MLKKFLNEVVVIAVGKQAEVIADLLDSNRHVNEFIIAKKMDITINQTRNILYKLSDFGLVSSIRKKDKRKGWYTYFWKIEVSKSLQFLKNILLKKIEQVNNQIRSREMKEFYVCERCSIEFNEENALINNFTCNECGDIFTLKDNTNLLRELKRHLSKFNRELDLVEEEIEKDKQKIEKIRTREFKKQEKEDVEKKKLKKMMKNKVGESKKDIAKKVTKSVKKKPSKKKPSKKK
ncbi:MAG: hypothetical protein ABIA78_04320 [archaeon]